MPFAAFVVNFPFLISLSSEFSLPFSLRSSRCKSSESRLFEQDFLCEHSNGIFSLRKKYLSAASLGHKALTLPHDTNQIRLRSAALSLCG